MTRFRLAVLLLLAALVLAACGGGPAADADDNAVAVAVVPVTRQPISRSITFTAQAEAKDQATLVAEVAGQVASVPVEVGQWVEAGTVLIQLDTSVLAQQVSQAEGAVQQARAALSDARQAYDSARREYERMQPLYEAGAVAEKDWQQLVDGLERARLAAEVQAPAHLQQAEAGLAMARSQLDKAAIKAPMAGEVAAIMTSPGNMVAPGTPVAAVVVRDEIELNGVLGDRQVVEVQPGLPVTVTIGALPGRQFEGQVHTVAPAANPQAGGFPVTVRLPNPDGVIRPGMLAEVRIPVEQAASALVVPVDAVLQRNGESVVYVVVDDKAVERVVTTGVSDGVHTAITAGLSEGDLVVVSGQHFLADGMPVQAQPLDDTGDDSGPDEAGDAPDQEEPAP